MTHSVSTSTPITISPDPLRQGNYKSHAPNVPEASEDFWGEDGFSFGDLIDIVNPLQHIPVVSSIYRAITGDEISTGARLIGGGLLSGGLIAGAAGFMMEIGNSVMAQETGKDIGDTVFSALTGSGKEGQAQQEVRLAQAETAAPDSAFLLGKDTPLPAVLPEAVSSGLAAATPAQRAAEALAQTPISEISRQENRAQLPAYNQYKRTQMLDQMNQRALKILL